MKYIKKFNEDNTEESIENWCKKFHITNYTINDIDNTVDVYDDVKISGKSLIKIPLQFGIVNGNFNCDNNQLTTLKGSPKKVNKDYICNANYTLDTLEGGPEIVGLNFICHYMSLKTLEYSPIKVGLSFGCYRNELESLMGCTQIIPRILNCGSNKLTSLEGGPEIVGSITCQHNYITTLKGLSKNIKTSLDCRNNKLLSLDNAPINQKIDFYFSDNPIYEIYKLFNSNYNLYKDSLDYNYLRGDCIIKLRFQEALEEAGIDMPESIRGYKYI